LTELGSGIAVMPYNLVSHGERLMEKLTGVMKFFLKKPSSFGSICTAFEARHG
jgi:hypothetical protein